VEEVSEMSGRKESGKGRRKRGRHQSAPGSQSTPSPEPRNRQAKEIKLGEVAEKIVDQVWPNLNESLVDEESDIEWDRDSDIGTVPEMPEPHPGTPDMAVIIAMLKEHKTRLVDAPSWHCGLVAIVETLCGKVKCLEEDNIALIASLEFTQADLKKSKEEIQEYKGDKEALGDCMVKLSQVVQSHVVNIEVLEEKAIKADSYQRGKNLLFRGIPEERGDSAEECQRKVDGVIARWLDLEPCNMKFNRCHRVGPPPSRATHSNRSAPRPILDEFNWAFNRQQVLERGFMLARSSYSIEEDHPIEVIQRRATLNPIVKNAKRTRGFEGTKMVGDKLIVRGRAYSVDEVPNLPEEINPCLTATKTDGKSTLFYTRYSMLSNHAPAAFILDDNVYRHSEQFYFAEKARISGDESQRSRILATKDPKECQRLGRSVRNNNGIDWVAFEETVMTKACDAKFKQNKLAKQALLKTGNTRLAESSRSKHWGSGMMSDHPQAFNQDRWENNLLGRVLESVRAKIVSQNAPPIPPRRVRVN
jgi:hypothetical protein